MFLSLVHRDIWFTRFELFIVPILVTKFVIILRNKFGKTVARVAIDVQFHLLCYQFIH